jgi:predicted ATPase with chaperone activity
LLSDRLLERINIYGELPEVDFEKMSDDDIRESSSENRKRVEAVRDW